MAQNTDIIKVLRACRKAGVTPILWGDPGIGKSSLLETLARQDELPLEIVIGSVREPSDIAGLPRITEHGTVIEPPAWAKRLSEAGEGILFLDELSTSAPAVQAAMLRVVLDRYVGEMKLPEGVCVVAAANPPESAAGGWELAPPMANRLCHLDVTPDLGTFFEGMTLGWDATITTESGAEASDLSLGRASRVRGEVAAFLKKARPALLHAMPKDEAAAGRAWPSPRTWEMTAKVLGHLDADGDEGAILLATRGLVGEAAAIEFLTWRKDVDLPDPAEVLLDPSIMDWGGRDDRVFAVLSGVVGVVAAEGTKVGWGRGWNVLAACADAGKADVAAQAALDLTKCRPDGAPWPKAVKAFSKVLTDSGALTTEKVAA